MKKAACALTLLGLSACTTTHPAAPEASYRYAVSLRRLEQHRLRVRVLVPPVPTRQAVFVLPKTVPGIYGA